MIATYQSLYPESLSNGIGLISEITSRDGIPWAGAVNVEDLERLYSIRSGFKTVTAAFINTPSEHRPDILLTLFKHRWKRLWDDYNLTYNPLDAYRVIETGTRNTETSDRRDFTHGHTVSEQGTSAGTIGTESESALDTTDGVYGFNSSSSVPAATGTESTTSADTETRDLTSSRNVTNAGTDNTVSAGTDNEEYQYEKAGNIGYTTPQELLRQDIELWREPYFDQVFNDIDSFITIMVY